MEVASPDFDFDPARVEITSKGKMRARRVNNLGSGQPVTLAYPLRFKAKVSSLDNAATVFVWECFKMLTYDFVQPESYAIFHAAGGMAHNRRNKKPDGHDDDLACDTYR